MIRTVTQRPAKSVYRRDRDRYHDRMRQVAPEKEFIGRGSEAVCAFMRRSRETACVIRSRAGSVSHHRPTRHRRRARGAIDRMVALG